MKQIKKLVLPILTLAIFAVGCSDNSNNASEPQQQQQQQGEIPPLEFNIKTKEWSPMMLQYGDEKSLEAYQFAVEHPEVLDYMPCYCGCFEEDGHTNNTDCFVDSVNEDVARLDSMGLG